MKKWTALVLTLMMLVTALPATAYELPHAFWAINDGYTAALNAKDYSGIITYGTQTLELIANEPRNEQVVNILSSRLYEVATAYARLGQYEASVPYFTQFLEVATTPEWYDKQKIARARIEQYTPVISLYGGSDVPAVTYGAKNEPNGVLYGQVSEHSEEDESMLILYVEYGNELTGYDKHILDQAKARGIAVEFAWNFPLEGAQPAGILQDDDYISRITRTLGEYPEVPIYLRIGAEMNLWNNKPDPAAFIAAFRHIAEIARREAPNVATVWSVGFTSDWYTDMDVFYPGDEYVDWVGISAYMLKHFQGRLWSEEEDFTELAFKAGEGADPVLVVNEVVARYGDRKPIMIAEGGAAHYTHSLGEDSTDWAAVNLRRMYAYLPMVYPQIKLMGYFNKYMAGENNDYSLVNNPTLAQTYDAATAAQPALIKGRQDAGAKLFYNRLYSGFTVGKTVVPVYAYAHIYGHAEPQLQFYIDGVWAGASSTLPYRVDLDFSGLSDGEHVITIRAVADGVIKSEQAVTVQVVSGAYGEALDVWQTEYALGGGIQVNLDGAPLALSAAPVMEADRTLVPLRDIFEALGAEVTWDGETQTVTATRGSDSVSLSIDSNVLYKNGTPVTLDVPARLVRSKTMVPTRAVAESFGAQVGWEEATHTVLISTQ